MDFVFLTAQLLAGAATVAAAKNLNFDPEWATVGNNITKTVAQFYATTKDAYDGAWGLDTTFLDFSDEREGVQHDGRGRRRRGVPRGIGRVRLHRQHLPADPDPRRGDRLGRRRRHPGEGDLPRSRAWASWTSSRARQGSLSKEKHDAGDYVFLSRYSADTEMFEPYDDRKPLKVP